MKHGQSVVDLSFPAKWESTVLVREHATSALEADGWEPEIVEAAAMCITELTENAIKYGDEGEKNPAAIRARVVKGRDQIEIAVSNKIRNTKETRVLVELIEKMKLSTNPEELHIRRMKEIEKNPKQLRTRLGIFRIMYEGKFVLDYRIEEEMLTVVAMRTTNTEK